MTYPLCPRALRLSLIATFALLAIVTIHSRAHGFAFTTAEQRCRDAASKGSVTLATTAARAFNGCHRDRDTGSEPATTDCNDSESADPSGDIARAAQSLATGVGSRCTGIAPATVNYDACPTPCDGVVPSITGFADVAACLECLMLDGTELLSGFSQGSPVVPLQGAALDCHREVGRAQTKHFRTALREGRRCQKRAEIVGASDTGSCIGADPRGKITKAALAAQASIVARCSAANLASVASCSTASAGALADCVIDDSAARADELFQQIYDFGAGVVSTTTTTNTTTTTLGPQDPLCPETSELVLYGRTGDVCTSNGDCVVGTCDIALGRCKTATDLDTGWTGISHNSDISDAARFRAQLRCEGPFNGASSEPCGLCNVIGVDPSAGACRCANDNRALCDEPFVADADDCGGNVCNCYLGPPLPLSGGNTPVCVVNRFREDIRGTANVDIGATATEIALASVVYLGSGLTVPCPYCSGDPVVADGLRGGSCVFGKDAGASCDSDAVNRTFPAPGGDGHSLDCFPEAGANITGGGLKIGFEQTTGTANSIVADIPCFFNNYLCHCMVCTGDTSLACDSDAVCAAAGAGTCTTFANGANPRPNACVGDFLCADQGGGEGRCNQNPDTRFCDGVTTADGRGFVACNTNTDCSSSSCGSVSCGACTIVERRPCFLNTIAATGVVNPGAPVTVGTFCIPPTSNGGVNATAGLPGPGRLANQASSTLFCASNPAVEYVPGTGGCP